MLRINFFLLLAVLFSSYIQITAYAKFDKYLDVTFKNKSSKYTVIVKKGIQPGMQNNTYVAYHLSPGQKEVYYTGVNLESKKSEWFISVIDGTTRLCSNRIVFLFPESRTLVTRMHFGLPVSEWKYSLYLQPLQTKNANFNLCRDISISPNHQIKLAYPHRHHYPISITILPPKQS